MPGPRARGARAHDEVTATVSGTARRLFIAFSLVLLAFGAASFFAVRGLLELHTALHQVKHEEAAARATLALAAAVRDVYAHQAHTLILGNATHLPLYEAAQQRAQGMLDTLRAEASSDEERRRLDSMAATYRTLDSTFRHTLLPAVLAQDRATGLREHARLLERVSSVQREADALADAHERAIGGVGEHASAVQHRSILWMLALLVAAAALAVAVGVYIGRSVARPVAQLELGAARLAAGDLGARIDVDGPDEFGRLAQQFNRMAQALEEDRGKLVQSEKLAGIGRLAAGVAHEINNPLGVILGYTRLLQNKAQGGPREDLRIIEDETLRARDIVQGLLDFSRPEPGGNGAPVELAQQATAVVQRLREAGALPCPDVRVHGEAHALGHPPRLHQVLTNLICNAAEAAGGGGRVEVEAAQDARGAWVSVRDSGPGLSAAALQHLFEPFFTTKPRGTGLGLAISRTIAQAHGGELRARNLPGGGAEFTLQLPRST